MIKTWPDYALANSIHHLVMKMGPSSLKNLFHEVDREARKRGMLYEEEDGSRRPIHLMLRPRLISPKQRDYFLHACRMMNQAFAKLSRLYLEHSQVQALFPFTPKEQEWMMEYLPKQIHTSHTLISRWDANTNFSGKNWRASFHFLEVNGVGVGGLHYTPTAEGIILDKVIEKLKKYDGNLEIEENDDVRKILLAELKAHLKALGRKRCNIGLVQDDRFKGGPLDFFYLTKFFRNQGVQAKIIDPRDLAIKKGEIMAGDLPLDILYRDTTLEEFIEMEEEGHRLTAVKKAFEENIVVSSLGGELDHKSALEVFSSQQFSGFFTPEERKCFRRHIPWTRMIREVRTTNPDGKKVDLISYALRHRENLILKPNRGYGGMGILVGEKTTSSVWKDAIDRALKESGSHILQQKCTVRKKKFPWLNAQGQVVEKNLNVVCGFIYSRYGLGILGRASESDIVNVAQQGGMTAILICKNR